MHLTGRITIYLQIQSISKFIVSLQIFTMLETGWPSSETCEHGG